MSEKFTVWVVEPEGDKHARALHEVAQGIQVSLAELGREARLVYGPRVHTADRLIVFNAHHLRDEELPDDAILFNAEQLLGRQENDAWKRYVARLRKHIVWDYSQVNVEQLKKLEVRRVAHCRVGYYTALTKITPVKEDIDVLFYGSLNDRRMHILTALQKRDINVRHLFGVYGAPRDAFIARSKIVLNVHFFAKPIWEVFRVSYLLANKKCAVTEDGGVDEELERLAAVTCCRTRYEDLVERCAALLEDEESRRWIANEGFSEFALEKQVDEVRSALEAS